ncbi:hypothetical protein OS493_027545 [Desmophyllum pertusum]|uniref:Selenoprotein O n=1 Tax=Desmophyllum pertusum TaxID=174260 RepID=A0A9W9ZY62_9CNID|nr:hypothetical protein OS493_027545 [Desmophyllum pertusum]
MATLETLNLDNLALRTLPIDKEVKNYVRQVQGACFSRVEPTPVENAETVAYSSTAMALLDLTEDELKRDDFAEFFSGNKLLPGAEPAAHCYCGHQFGYFSGQLGDGAAMYLGEVVNQKGERWEIQFKGAGLTPFSRQADGRKVLRSSIREFLCSEAMHFLGIPTTRAGSCVTSDTRIIRDIFYDGNPIREKCTIILRIAPTFIRFGSFEIFKPTDPRTGRKGPSEGRTDILIQLLDYTVKTFFPEVVTDNSEETYLAFFKEVVRLTARLVAKWQCVGFCHGVLNTDNMSILGLTIDYGPFGFLDHYDPGHVCNGSDDQARYCYQAQPEICKWNLIKFAEAIRDVLPLERSKAAVEEIYDVEYQQSYMEKMRLKLGLLKKQSPEDKDLVQSLLETMQKTGADFTNCFRCLCRVSLKGVSSGNDSDENVLDYLVSQCQTVDDLKKASKPFLGAREFQMLMMLLQTSPSLLEQLGSGATLIQKELERRENVQQMNELKPEEKKAKDKQLWKDWIEKYRLRLTTDIEDEQDHEKANKERVEIMKSNNPRFILRNYIAQNAISAAEKGDFSEVQRVLQLLQNPYSDDIDVELNQEAKKQAEPTEAIEASCSATVDEYSGSYDSKPPGWAVDLRVT